MDEVNSEFNGGTGEGPCYISGSSWKSQSQLGGSKSGVPSKMRPLLSPHVIHLYGSVWTIRELEIEKKEQNLGLKSVSFGNLHQLHLEYNKTMSTRQRPPRLYVVS